MSTQIFGAEAGPVPSGFNWGAFLFTSIFLLFNGRIGTALLLIFGGGFVSGVLGEGGAVIVGIGSFLISLYFGFTAKEIAWETGRHATYADLERSMRRWNIGALTIMGLLIVLILLVAVAR